MMSHPAASLGDGFCVSRKGALDKGSWVGSVKKHDHAWSCMAMKCPLWAISHFSVSKTLPLYSLKLQQFSCMADFATGSRASEHCPSILRNC